MLLSALLLATSVQAAPVPPTLGDRLGPGRATFHGAAPRTVEVVKTPEACQAPGVELAVGSMAGARVRELGELPMANHTLTVLRSVEGCPVSSTVRYNVDQPAKR
jgi:hypothetical protein